jgi:hypothetical protein
VIIAGSGTNSSVRDGVNNVASGTHSFAGGGAANTSGSDYSFIGGGQTNTVSPAATASCPSFAVVGNGNYDFCATGNLTQYFICGDNFIPLTLTGPSSCCKNFYGNYVGACYDSASNWTCVNTCITCIGDSSAFDCVQIPVTNLNSSQSAIVSGSNNVVNGAFSFIGGGGGQYYNYTMCTTNYTPNKINHNANYSFIGGGNNNTITPMGVPLKINQSSFVYTGSLTSTSAAGFQCATSGAGTCGNFTAYVELGVITCVTSQYMGSTPGTGYAVGDTVTIPGTNFSGGSSPADDVTFTIYQTDTITGSAILGGGNNVICHANAFVAGCGITTRAADALHVNNLIVANIPTANPSVCGQVWSNSGVLYVSGY